MRNESGQALLEVLIGVTILAAVIVALMYGLQGGIWGTKAVHERTTALNIAQSQIEYIKFLPYDYQEPYEYATISDVPPGYDIAVAADAVYRNGTAVEGLQLITVTVTYDGKSVVVEGYKGDE